VAGQAHEEPDHLISSIYAPPPHNSKEKTRRTPRRRSLPPALRHPADTYSGLDRFGRTKQQLWRYYGGTPADRDRFEYSYDRNSNRTSKDLTLTAGKDEKYAYDNLNRLTSYDRGTLSGGDITNKVRNEAWGLSPTGAWSDYQIDANGDGDYSDTGTEEVDQNRTHNLANEIFNETPGAAITEGQGQSAWADPAYSARGNMTKVPQPSDLTSTYASKYDAWNRLMLVWVDSDSDGVADAGETVIARYEYDALNRRTKEFINADTDDDFDSFRHFYYTFGLGRRSLGEGGWQLLETRLSSSENTDPETLQPEYQYVWSLRYIDAAVLRDKNTDSDDLCDDERLYYLNDANMNVTCLVEDDGDVAERYVYDPYGNCTVYDDDWSDTVSWANSKKNNIRFCGYYLDNETGLYSVRHRVLLPNLGWMQRDPLRQMLADKKHGLPTDRFAGGVSARRDGANQTENLYEYVKSLPTSRYDPKGLGCCGPDIGDKLRELMTQLERDFENLKNLSPEDAEAVCDDMVDTTGWDIRELMGEGCSACTSLEGCGTPPCDFFIAVDGVCHLATDVNYVLWGRMNKLCGNSEDFATGFATLYTTVLEWWGAIRHLTAPSESSNHTDPANDWTRAGYNYNGTFPVSHRHPSSKDCGICGKDYKGELNYAVGAGLRALLHLRHGISGGTGKKEPPEMQKLR